MIFSLTSGGVDRQFYGVARPRDVVKRNAARRVNGIHDVGRPFHGNGTVAIDAQAAGEGVVDDGNIIASVKNRRAVVGPAGAEMGRDVCAGADGMDQDRVFASFIETSGGVESRIWWVGPSHWLRLIGWPGKKAKDGDRRPHYEHRETGGGGRTAGVLAGFAARLKSGGVGHTGWMFEARRAWRRESFAPCFFKFRFCSE